jgi:hypothetical protein
MGKKYGVKGREEHTPGSGIMSKRDLIAFHHLVIVCRVQSCWEQMFHQNKLTGVLGWEEPFVHAYMRHTNA